MHISRISFVEKEVSMENFYLLWIWGIIDHVSKSNFNLTIQFVRDFSGALSSRIYDWGWHGRALFWSLTLQHSFTGFCSVRAVTLAPWEIALCISLGFNIEFTGCGSAPHPWVCCSQRHLIQTYLALTQTLWGCCPASAQPAPRAGETSLLSPVHCYQYCKRQLSAQLGNVNYSHLSLQGNMLSARHSAAIQAHLRSLALQFSLQFKGTLNGMLVLSAWTDVILKQD